MNDGGREVESVSSTSVERGLGIMGGFWILGGLVGSEVRRVGDHQVDLAVEVQGQGLGHIGADERCPGGGEVPAGVGKGVKGCVNRDNAQIRGSLGQERRRESARTRAQINRKKRGGGLQGRQGIEPRLGHDLSFGTRDEDPRTHRQLEGSKCCDPGQMLQGDPTAAQRHQVIKAGG